MSHDSIDNLWPLKEIQAQLVDRMDNAPSLHQLQEWYRKADATDFPAPVRKIGKHLFFDIDEVEDWVILWLRATANYKNNFAKE